MGTVISGRAKCAWKVRFGEKNFHIDNASAVLSLLGRRGFHHATYYSRVGKSNAFVGG